MDKDLSKLTLAELKNMAKELSLSGVSSLKKDELAALIANSLPAEKKPAAKKPAVRKSEAKQGEKAGEKPTEEKSAEKKPAAKKTETSEIKKTPAEKKTAAKASEKTEEKPAEKKTAAKASQKTEEKPAEKKAAVKASEKTEEKPAEKKAVARASEKTEEKTAEKKAAVKASEKTEEKPAEKKAVARASEKAEEKPAEKKAAIKASEKTEEKPAEVHTIQKTEEKPVAKRPASDVLPPAMRAYHSDGERTPMQVQQRPAGQNGQHMARPVGPDGRPYQRPVGQNGQPIIKPAGPGQHQRPVYQADQRQNGQSIQNAASQTVTRSQGVQSAAQNVPPQQADRNQASQPAQRPVPPRDSVTEEYNGTQVATGTIANMQSTNEERIQALDSGISKEGILEVMADGYGFIRCDNFLPGDDDVYVSPAQIRKLNLKTGDFIVGNTKQKTGNEKFSALLYVKSINGFHPGDAVKRPRFEDLTPIFPNSRLHLETPGCGPSMRLVDLLSPIGKGQRGMIVSQPKAGKTTLLKQVAKAIQVNHPEEHIIILLIDERPEEVTDMKESIVGDNVEVIYSTFDELPDNHKRVSEMVIERAKRLVEHGQDVIILLDSITRLARAYNLTVTASGRTLSGGLDPAALYMPKRFFGAARNMREGGSLTVLATALVETGSRMDDVVYEEFKGTGNMELVLDRSLSERRIFPAIDLPKSSTRREDLLLSQSEVEANYLMRRAFNTNRTDEAVDRLIGMMTQTKSNAEFVAMIKRTKILV